MPAARRFAPAALAAFLALAAHAQDEPATPDPVEQAWVWLLNAPVLDSADQAYERGPALKAFDDLAPRLHPDAAAGQTDLQGLPRIALARRLEAQLATVPQEPRARLIEFLSANEGLATALALAIGPGDDVPAAYAVLGRLIEAHGARAAELAPLAAAICIVHDQPRERRVNENTAPLIDPVALFGYYAANERRLRFSPRTTPASALVFVADANGSVEQLEWAARRYGRDRNLGNRYKEISYDTRAFKQDGAEKRVTGSGAYTLENIRRFGGVCADQAYFAMTVGKASGVPACYVVGRGGEVSHAWLGFLEPAGREGGRWNFSAGRYDAYEDTQGSVLHPQAWERLPDAFLSVAALDLWTSPDDRLASVALADAAARLAMFAEAAGDERPAPQRLALLEAALRKNPGNLPAWRMAREELARPGLDRDTISRWTRAIDTLAGQSSPDFAFEMLEPMFNAEPDLETRHRLWDWAAQRYGGRPDLAARARLAQARIRAEQDRAAAAYDAARDVFARYHEAGPVAIEALHLAESLLSQAGKGVDTLELYKWAFQRLRDPGRMQSWALRQTSWHRVGTRYAELLEAAGDTSRANALRRRLDR
jgi:hypothetical protein